MPSIRVSVERRFAKPLMGHQFVRLWFEGEMFKYPFFSAEAADLELCRLVFERTEQLRREGVYIVDYRQVGQVQELLVKYVDEGLARPCNGYDKWARDTIDAGLQIPLGEEQPPPQQEAEPEPAQAPEHIEA